VVEDGLEPSAVTSEPDQAGAPETQDGSAGRNDADLIEADILVEDVSIDGMCGVY
jgi:mycofactocin precursor